MTNVAPSTSPQPRAAIVLARSDSSRFPRKCFAKLGGLTVIESIYRRLIAIECIGNVLMATTARACDDELADSFLGLGGSVYRHSESKTDDVAGRLVCAASEVGVEYALRVNGDSPFPIPSLIRAGTKLLNSSPDLVTNLIPRSYPYGSSVEWIKVATLRDLLPNLSPAEREHPTSYFYKRPSEFQIRCLPALERPCPEFSLTVDHPADIARLEKLLARCDADITAVDLSALIAAGAIDRNASVEGST